MYRCRDIDPVEDTERSDAVPRPAPESGCRDIDPVEDTESSKSGFTGFEVVSVAGISIRLRILKDGIRV